ncbi:bifunctional adenosylcobinamide kinase/adenosylcobinamide-phosphate guanylyltransferase [Anaerocolumna sp. MB42-C2]|uniref:bifunctional adenosylcobinamide kinase/adenosylcobinamide-phosphate guanylyltransferase n=1 Tax=Anaerocolumna sp. MB42-C2 TaxID=3070997 RepID=UPI0027DF0CC0|nr:bifunctional adenosylcobinamide kinase/adenosylcobinamide-phosphate guanylyltransferase [Anaerocolumna sp. MB42-C2]WMJ89527.1 bifunctional adenosylcobinamide kinase/adenosylcobinamide-phosphate guanylyltransferase [Anaerocolumna sp. MB42-C2]
MIILVTGGSGSGKSKFAENLAVKLRNKDLLYIATMIPMDEESLIRIKRHQNQRKEKGFQTLERYTDLKNLEINNYPAVLLECMSNLLANEMYCENGISNLFEKVPVKEEILKGITHLAAVCEHVIIVSNEVFSDNGSHYEETSQYINILGEINCTIANMASNVYEIVCGIPVCQKGADIL